LKDISFDVNRGEKIVILGPSGSGKSTLLRCINQLEHYDGGEILFEGKPVDDPKELYKLRENIGMVFQDFNIFKNMTALENVMVAPVAVKHIGRSTA
jgi:ABC-type polar amino acid transport system ATPase subunit